MNKYRRLIDHFKNRSFLLNIILDGYGIGKQDHTDAIWKAKTPVMDRIKKTYPNTTLWTHGKFVGLSNDTDMGGSEVGHMTIGAGIVPVQGSKRINAMIGDGSFDRQTALQDAINNAKQSSLHLMGLLSDGNIHSHIDHWFAIIRFAFQSGIKACYFHVLLDGRDVGIQSADFYIHQLESFVKTLTKDDDTVDYRIVSGGGREHMTMDRSLQWDKVKIGWDAHVHGVAEHYFPSATAAVQSMRDKTPNIIDQDLSSFVIPDSRGERHSIKDGDSVLCVNFRGDRAVEMSRAFVEKNFREFDTGKRPDVFYCGMTVYDQDTNMPANAIIGSSSIENPFGKRILTMGLNQFRLAETQKFPHVTFFFNGGYRLPLDPKKETYHIIPSDVIDSFSMKPAMKATEIKDKAIEFIKAGQFNYGLINFANADMVGHTGDFDAVTASVEAVDGALGELLDEVEKNNGVAMVTADHGNADEMFISNHRTGRLEISTKHSLNPVPFVIVDPRFNANYALKENTDDSPLGLSMIAASNFIMLGQSVPDDLSPFIFDV